jgi:hypothetical protein
LRIDGSIDRTPPVVQIQFVRIEVAVLLILFRIPTLFRPKRDVVFFVDDSRDIECQGEPLPGCEVLIQCERRDTGAGKVHDVRPLVVVLIKRQVSPKLPAARQRVVVLSVHVAASVCGPGPRIIEDRSVRRGRNCLRSRAVNSLEREIAVLGACEKRSCRIPISIHGIPVVGLGRIELREV